MKILILEDDLSRIGTFMGKLGSQHGLSCVDTADKAIKLLENEKFDVIFLDHDLGGEQMVDTTGTNTGSEVVRWIIGHHRSFGDVTFIVHSLNAPAASSMTVLLKDYFQSVHRIPFTSLMTNYLDDPSFLSND